MTEEAPRRWRLRNPSVWCAALPAGPGQDAGFAGGRGGCAPPEMAGLEDDRSRDRLVELPVAMKDLRIAAGRPAAHRLADLPGLIHARSARGLETIPWRLALQERLARIFLPAAWLCLAAAFFWRRFVRPSPLEWAGFALGAAGCGAVIQFVLASSAQAGWLPPAPAVWLMPLLLVLAGWAVARIPVR